eukprot:2802318-Pleurochrysis_carterae.AAC.1
MVILENGRCCYGFNVGNDTFCRIAYHSQKRTQPFSRMAVILETQCGEVMILKNGNGKAYVLQNQLDHSTEWLHPMERIDAGRNG